MQFVLYPLKTIYLYLNNTAIECFILKYFSFADCHTKLYLEGWSPFQENTFNSSMDFQTFIGDGEEKMMTYIKGNQKFHSVVQCSTVQYSTVHIDYFMFGKRVRFLFTSCEESQTNERGQRGRELTMM